MKALILLMAVPLVGCGGGSDKPGEDSSLNPPVIPEPVTPPESPRVKATPELRAALNARKAGLYEMSIRLFTAELAKEEAKAKPSWVQVSFLNSQMGLVFAAIDQLAKALEFHQKSLAIKLKSLPKDHPSVATSYNNMAYVYKAKKDLPKAKEFWEKAYTIFLKKLGPDHPGIKDAKAELDALR